VAVAVVTTGVVYGIKGLHHHTTVADSCQVVGESTGTVYTMDPDQLLNASTIADLAMRRGLPQQAVIVALATAMQESKLTNIDYGDRDSIGLFQQRPSEGWGTKEQLIDPIYAAGKFFDALVKVSGWQDLPVAAAAQAVQRSGFPDAYTSWQPRATALAAALTGTTFGRLTCRLGTPGIAVPTTSGSTQPTVASVVASLTSALSNDLGDTTASVVDHGTKSATITVSGLQPTATTDDGSAKSRAATAAAWALAHADQGITAVVSGDQEWQPDRNGWRQLKAGAASGDLVLTVTAR
jgi:hypothetical protein